MAVGRGLYRYLAAEHVLTVFMLAYTPIILIQTQYIEKRIREQPGVANVSSGSAVNKSSPEDRLGERVQQESSIWSLYLTASTALTMMLSANIWAALSEKYGRRIAFILPCIGLAVNAVVNLLVVRFHLPLYVLIFGSLAQGTFGGLAVFLVGCSGYIADVTVPDSRERTFRFVMVDVITLLSATVCTLASGFVIRTCGFVTPYLAIVGLVIIATIFIIFFLPVRRIAQPDKDTAVCPTDEIPSNPLGVLKNIHSLFARERRRGWLLAGYNFVPFGMLVFSVTLPAISIMYTTAEPFCMDPLYEGYYQAVVTFIYGVGVLIGGLVLTKILGKFWSMHLAFLTFILSLVITAFANSYLMLYLGSAIGVLVYLYSPLCRDSMANLVDSDEQGVLFAFNGCLLSLSQFLSPVVFNAIYSGTLHFMRGFVYLAMALVALTCWGVVVLLHIFEPKRRKGYISLDDQGITKAEDDGEVCATSCS